MATKPKLSSKPMRGGSNRRLRADEVEEIFRRFRKGEPNPTTELEYTNAYTLLVAVALSAQMTDAGVNKATKPLFMKIDHPAKMVRFGEEKLQQAIAKINFNRTKAKNVIAMSKRLLDDFAGEVPEDREALESLPGIGRKTANVILNTIFRHPTLAVDTHVFRVSNRTGIAYGETPLEIEEGLLQTVPEKYLVNAHHWLILHGRYVCTARRPDCPRCIIRDICLFPDKTQDIEKDMPVNTAKTKSTSNPKTIRQNVRKIVQ